MKILIVNKFLYPNGGSETYIFQLGRELTRLGHEVQYFGMEHEGRIVGNHAESYTSDMDFHAGGVQKLLYPFKIIYSVEARKKIRKVLEDFEPEVVHLNNFNFQLTPSIIYEIRKFERKTGRKIKIVATVHDYQMVCPNHMMRIPGTGENCERCLDGKFINCTKNRCIHNSKVKSALGSVEGYFYYFLKTYRSIDTVICPTRFIKEKMDRSPFLRGKTVVMHNFIDIEKGNCEKKGYVLYFGRYSEEKGIRTLIGVCRRLKEIPFVFAGGGPLEKELETVENIHNVGFVRGDRLKTIIQEASFSVYPSEWYENCPFSVMESQAYGTPVVGARIGGIPELIRDGVTGELFESGNEEELYKKISELWKDKAKIKEYSEKCKNSDFSSAQEYTRHLLELYTEK